MSETTNKVKWLKSLGDKDFAFWLDHAVYNKLVIPKQLNSRIKKLVKAKKLSPFYMAIATYNKGT